MVAMEAAGSSASRRAPVCSTASMLRAASALTPSTVRSDAFTGSIRHTTVTEMNRTFAVLSTGAGVFSLLQSLIGPVLPTIQHELGTSQNTVTWVLTAYLLSASVATPILGRVGDMFGKDR